MHERTYLLDGTEYRKSEVGLSRLLGGDTADHTGSVLERFSHMESTLSRRELGGKKEHIRKLTHSLSGETLAEDLGVLVD